MALFGALRSDETGARPFPGGLDVLLQALPTPSAQGAVENTRVFHEELGLPFTSRLLRRPQVTAGSAAQGGPWESV